MSNSEKPHFSNRALELAEGAQAAIGNLSISKMMVSAVTGSNSSSYRQFNWQSKGITANILPKEPIPGDPSVRRLAPARFWHNAAVIAVPNFEADPVWEQGGVEAIAYVSKGVPHVGTLREDTKIFNPLNNDEVALGMRLASGLLLPAMGIWLPDERHFEESPGHRVVADKTPVNSFDTDYPGLLLG